MAALSLMKLIIRNLLWIVPSVVLILGALTYAAFSTARTQAEEVALVDLSATRQIATGDLQRKLDMIAQIERRASTLMLQNLASGNAEVEPFERIFTQQADGTFRTPDTLWDGSLRSGGIRLSGIGGMMLGDGTDQRARTNMRAAYGAMKAMVGGLPASIRNLYFFTPSNDLLIWAPAREDRLLFYRRDAPPEFDFQDEEFSTISAPSVNPSGSFRCTSLQRPAYDQEQSRWTTGCMLPVRSDGAHIGAWGISIPLPTLIRELPADSAEQTTIIISDQGQLIRHPSLVDEGATPSPGGLQRPAAAAPGREDIFAYAKTIGREPQTGYVAALDAYVSAERLDNTPWIVLTVMPQARVRDRSLAVAAPIMFGGAVGAIILVGILALFFGREISAPLGRLAKRADALSLGLSKRRQAASDHSLRGNEIGRLNIAFERMEQRIAEDQRQLMQSFDTLADAVEGYAMMVVATDGQVQRANAAALDLFPDLENNPHLMTIYGYDAAARDAAAQLLADARDKGGMKTRLRQFKRQERPVWLEENVEPLKDEDGEIYAYAYVAHDQTEQRARQMQVEQSLLFLEMAQTTAAMGHFNFDPATMTLTLSSWVRDQLGLAEETLPLAELMDFIVEERREEAAATIAAAIVAEDEFSFETIFRNVDGGLMNIAISGVAIHNHDTAHGRVHSFFGIAQDITAERSAENALRTARDEARDQLAARTNLLAVVSHEIRTPMTGILGVIDQVRNERSIAQRNRALSLVEESAEALVVTLDAILQQALATSEASSLPQKRFDPAKLVERTAGLFRPLARRKGLQLEAQLGCGGSVIGDPSRIQQVLANFVSNAVKFTQSGRVVLTCDPPKAEGEPWVFTVTDTGPGIPHDRLATLFEPFGGTRTDSLGKASGTGLGLSITKGLAEAMGGAVRAESEAGKGTSLVLELPLELAPDPALQEGDEPGGTIYFETTSASTAVLIEALASEAGMNAKRAADYSGEPDARLILVADEAMVGQTPEDLQQAADRVILLTQDGSGWDGDGAPGQRMQRLPMSDIARRLPGILNGEHNHG